MATGLVVTFYHFGDEIEWFPEAHDEVSAYRQPNREG